MAFPACDHGTALNAPCPECEKVALQKLRDTIDGSFITWSIENGDDYSNEAGRDDIRSEVVGNVRNMMHELSTMLTDVLDQHGIHWSKQPPTDKEKLVLIQDLLSHWRDMAERASLDFGEKAYALDRVSDAWVASVPEAARSTLRQAIKELVDGEA